MESEERAHLEKLLQEYQRRLRILELQVAQYGSSSPAHILLEIEDTRAEITRLESMSWANSVLGDVQTTLFADYERAASIQKQAGMAHQIVPEINAWVQRLCAMLDFVVVPNSYYLHHNRFVACRVKAPTLHLNLPTEFPLILILEEKLSGPLIKHLPDMLDMLALPTDFGLVFTVDSHTRTQQMVNRLIRPALKTDLIVLGRGFLEKIAGSTGPRVALLREILHEVDLTRVSPFMAGGADLMDRMFFAERAS